MAETNHDPLGLLEHDVDVTRHTGQASEEVECGANVLWPRAQSTPQVFNFLQVFISILYHKGISELYTIATYVHITLYSNGGEG